MLFTLLETLWNEGKILVISKYNRALGSLSKGCEEN